MKRILFLFSLLALAVVLMFRPKSSNILNKDDFFATADYGTSTVSIIDVKDSKNVNVKPVDILNNSEGAGPAAITVNKQGTKAYSANFDSSSVTVVNTKGDPNAHNISLPDGAFPYGIATLPDDSKLYIASSFSDTVDIIDTKTEKVTKRIDLAKGTYPYSIEVSPSGKRAYTVNRFSDSVTVINTSSDEVIATVDLPKGSKPTGIAIAADGSKIYTANRGNDSVSVIDARSLQVKSTMKAPAGSGPRWVAATSDDSILISANQAGRSATIFDLKQQKELATITIPSNSYNEGSEKNQVNPMAVAVSSDDRYAYVIGYFSEQIGVIDLSRKRLVDTIQGQHYSRPYHMAYYTPLKNSVAYINEDEVQVKELVRKGSKPEAYNGSAIVEICTPYQGISWPQKDAITSITTSGGLTAESDFLGSRLRLYNHNNLIQELDMGIGTRPNNLIFDRSRSRVFVAREGANSITEVSITESKIANTYDLPSYSGPQQIALSSDEKLLLTSTVSKELLLTDIQTKQSYSVTADQLHFIDCNGATINQTRITPESQTPNLPQSISNSADISKRNFPEFLSKLEPYSNTITKAQDKKRLYITIGTGFIVAALISQLFFTNRRSKKS